MSDEQQDDGGGGNGGESLADGSWGDQVLQQPKAALAFAPGCEEVIPDAARAKLVLLMAEHAGITGGQNVYARVPGFPHPQLLNGSIENYRPDLTFQQTDSDKTVTIIEAVPDVDIANIENRWSLLSSAAAMYKAELVFVVYGDTPKDNAAALKKRLAKMHLPYKRIVVA